MAVPSAAMRGWRVAGVLLASSAAWSASVAAGAGKVQPAAGKRLKAYPTRYYVIHTDLGPDVAREAAARMTAMAEEYHRRTRDFAGAIRRRLPFYLFGRAKDYHDAGGPAGTAGIYDPGSQRLMALADGGADENLWHTVRHEGFHQFAHRVIGGRLPTWIDEGLAEYFGHGVWTGDGFVTGVIPPYRLKRLQGHIRGGRLRPFLEMITLTHREWGDALHPAGEKSQAPRGGAPAPGPDRENGASQQRPTRARVHYDQAWSMVHFLVHADDGRYRQALSALIRDVSRGADAKLSFRRRLGRNVKAFEKRCADWWLARKPDDTADLYIQAVVATMTSYLARGVAQGQTFPSAEAFFREARSGTLKAHKTQWLPPSLLNEALLHARAWRTGWSLDHAGKAPRVVLSWPTGKVFTGTFSHARGTCSGVKVTVTTKKP